MRNTKNTMHPRAETENREIPVAKPQTPPPQQMVSKETVREVVLIPCRGGLMPRTSVLSEPWSREEPDETYQHSMNTFKTVKTPFTAHSADQHVNGFRLLSVLNLGDDGPARI